MDNKCVSNVLWPQLLLSRVEFNFSDTKVLITWKSKAIARKMCLEGHRFKTVEQSYSPSFTKSSQEEFAFFVFISFILLWPPFFVPVMRGPAWLLSSGSHTLIPAPFITREFWSTGLWLWLWFEASQLLTKATARAALMAEMQLRVFPICQTSSSWWDDHTVT